MKEYYSNLTISAINKTLDKETLDEINNLGINLQYEITRIEKATSTTIAEINKKLNELDSKIKEIRKFINMY